MSTLNDLLINEGDYIYLGPRIIDNEVIDRSFECPVEVLIIDAPLIKIKKDEQEYCLDLNYYPKRRKISNKLIPK